MVPQDIVDYLAEAPNRSFKIDNPTLEITEGTFYEPSAIPLRDFSVDSASLYSNGHLDYDPQQWRTYQGYDLVQEVNDYTAEGILVWFPELHQFGTCDIDHAEIITFPSATWRQIMQDPTWYFNAQWYCDEPWFRQENKFTYVNPWK